MAGLDTSVSQPAQAGFVQSARPGVITRYDDAVVAGFARLTDLALLLAAGLLVTALTRHADGAAPWGALLVVLGAGCLAATAVLQARGAYRVEQMGLPGIQAHGLLPALLAGGAAAGLCLALLQALPGFVAVWLPLWMLAAALLLTLARIAQARLLAQWDHAGRLAQRVAIVGATDIARAFSQAQIGKAGASRVKLVGIYRVGDEPFGEADTPYAVGTIDDLLARSREERIDSIVLALPAADTHRIQHVLHALGSATCDIHLAPEMPAHAAPTRPGTLGVSPVLTLCERPLKGWQGLQKAAFDRIVSAILLVLLAPTLALIALAIKLDSPGPVLFRQPRVGFNNRVFHIYKFRSMFHHLADRQANEQTRRGDRRVTAVGRVLRKLSLDELPQLLNTLRGEMSLVGPRPHALNTRAENHRLEDVADGYLNRHRVRPGITGWAQVNGCRGELRTIEQVKQRTEFDIHYIENWSMRLDLRILILTVVREIISKRAF